MVSLPTYSVPHLVHIELTYSCNAKCLFCYNPTRATGSQPARLDRIVSSVYTSHIPHVYLIGGEPSLLGAEKLNEYIESLSERSSVTIVTNGLQYLDGLSEKLACIGIPIHGIGATHDSLMGVPGALLKVVESVRKYVDRRFDVRCIPVLTSQNYQETYDIIRLAKQLGMDSVFVDRYEAGGLGTKQAEMLKPSIRQFREALTQMIAARDDFNMPVGFGTAIPFCLDERLLTENMYADCGVGTTFAAISPSGEFRLCNQSQIVYGNVLEKPIETIWKSKRIDEDFRSLQWVTEPCWSCALLSQCLCGCKVDLNCSDKYCVDYSVRGLKGPPAPVKGLSFKQSSLVFPGLYRRFEPNRYTKINKSHQEFYLVTRYQTIVLDSLAAVMLERILQEVRSEEHLIRLFSELAEEVDIRGLVTQLLNIGAIEPSE